jgi:hypothetical protein
MLSKNDTDYKSQNKNGEINQFHKVEIKGDNNENTTNS